MDSSKVILPNHYKRFVIEPVRFCQENKLDTLRSKVIKYIMRHDDKDGIQDLEKARRCLDMYIEYVKGNANWWRSPLER